MTGYTTTKRNNYSQAKAGSLSIELMVAVAIMAVLVNVLAVLGGSFKKVNDYRWLQHTLIAAGQSQMDAIASTGEPIDEETFNRLWPKVTCTIAISEGEGPWRGLQKVQLHLSAQSRQKTIRASFMRYIPMNEERHNEP